MITGAVILGGLALLDSTSIGTLFIPLWLLLAPGRLRADRIGLYLGVVALAYFAIGLVLLAGATALIDAVGAAFEEGGALDTPLFYWPVLIAGLGMLAFSFRTPKKREGPSRVTRWRERTMQTTSLGGLMGLALAAVALEVLTLFPYLGAVAYLSTADFGWGWRVFWLVYYCLVMIAPALVMLGVRLAMGERGDKALNWLNVQFDKVAGEAVLWMVGILGFLLAGFAASRLFQF